MKRIMFAGWLSLTLMTVFTAIPASAQPRLRIPYQTGQQSISEKIGNLPRWSHVMMLVAPLLGLLVIWPMLRAWLHTFCGNYDAAIRIYEKRLAQKPSHLRLYLTLTNLYLLAGRRDRRAVTAYAMMRLLHAACNPSEKNSAIAAAE